MNRAHNATAYLLRTTLADPLTRASRTFRDLSDPGAALGDLAEIAGTLSTGERLLYHLAVDLWNGNGDANVGELLRTLDDETYTHAMHAIRIRRPPLRGLRDLTDDVDADRNDGPPRMPASLEDPRPGPEEW